MTPCTIAIVGAGTTGLAAALYLTEDGHRVTLFERFDVPRPVGAGLMLQPTGLAALAVLRLDQGIIERSRVIHSLIGRTTSGWPVLDIHYRTLGEHAFGVGVHRAVLFGALYDAVLARGIAIETSADIQNTSVDQGGRWLTDRSGERYGPFDLVLDASGTRSQLRSACGAVKYVRAFSYGALWGVCDEPDDWPWPHILTQRLSSAQRMLGVLPLGRGVGEDRNQMAFFWSIRADGYDAWRERGIAEWHETIDDYWPEVSGLARSFPSVDTLTFATYDDVLMKSFHNERIVFLGDAAHATSPQLGQGANLGLIDALVFSRVLREADTLDTAFAQYERARRGPVQFYQIASRALTPLFQSDSRLAGFLRDATFAPLNKIPYMRKEMVRGLAGVKTGLFSSLDPEQWHKRYAFKRSR